MKKNDENDLVRVENRDAETNYFFIWLKYFSNPFVFVLVMDEKEGEEKRE